MVSGITSTSTKRSISALRIWYDGSDRSVGCTCVKTIIINTRKGLQWGPAMVDGHMLSRLQKGNLNDRIHKFMSDSEKKDDDSYVMGWEQVVSSS